MNCQIHCNECKLALFKFKLQLTIINENNIPNFTATLNFSAQDSMLYMHIQNAQ